MDLYGDRVTTNDYFSLSNYLSSFFFRLIVKFIRVCLISITPEMNLNL